MTATPSERELTSTSARSIAPGKIVIASHNQGKVSELIELVRPFGFAPIAASALGLAEPEEVATTFVGNAELKAVTAARLAGCLAIADDSGLIVPALDGAPGIFSARWGGGQKSFRAAMERVELELRASRTGPRDRRARLHCALTLAWPDSHCSSFEGHLEGQLVWPPRGSGGSGYDPMFVPLGHELTLGEVSASALLAIGARAAAFQKLKAFHFGALDGLA